MGHITLGCGHIVRQDLVKIDDAIADGSFYENQALNDAMREAGKKGGCVHLVGLVSNGGVHSQLEHLIALINHAGRHQVAPMLHMICDGRDTPPRLFSSNWYVPPKEPSRKVS